MKSPADDPIEELLEKLEAAPPSAALMARLRAAGPPELHAPSPKPVATRKRGATVIRLFIPAAAAAAAIALATTFREPKPNSAPARNSPETVADVNKEAEVKLVDAALLPLRESRRKLLDVRSLGTVRDELQRPVELLHTVWLDENTYAAPGAPEGLQETSRREEIVPVLLRPN